MFSIVLPFYNEEECVNEVVRSLLTHTRRHQLPIKFILVNNGSKDATGKIIDQLVREFKEVTSLTVKQNKGYGYGIRRGLRACKTAYLGFMCGDGQTDVDDLIKVVKELQNDPHLDICKVTRTKRHDGWKRRFISFMYNHLFTLLFFFPVKDVNGTPKIFKRTAYLKLNLISNDWFIDAELMLKAKLDNMSIKEIPTQFHPRKTGSSFVNNATIFEFLRNLLVFRLKTPIL